MEWMVGFGRAFIQEMSQGRKAMGMGDVGV